MSTNSQDFTRKKAKTSYQSHRNPNELNWKRIKNNFLQQEPIYQENLADLFYNKLDEYNNIPLNRETSSQINHMNSLKNLKEVQMNSFEEHEESDKSQQNNIQITPKYDKNKKKTQFERNFTFKNRK